MRRDIRKRAFAHNIRPECDLRDWRRDRRWDQQTLNASADYATHMTNTPFVTAAGNLVIRAAGEADARVLSAFASAAFNTTFRPDSDPADIDAYVADAFGPERQAAEIADPDRSCLLLVDGLHVVGYAMLRRDPGESEPRQTRLIELQRFYVDKAWHGRGVAARLMEACLRLAGEQQAATIWLGVWERNPRAIRFYAKQGFVDVGSQEFRLGSDLQTDRVMSRSVAEPT